MELPDALPALWHHLRTAADVIGPVSTAFSPLAGLIGWWLRGRKARRSMQRLLRDQIAPVLVQQLSHPAHAPQHPVDHLLADFALSLPWPQRRRFRAAVREYRAACASTTSDAYGQVHRTAPNEVKARTARLLSLLGYQAL